MATNTIELDPAAAIGSQAASALMGFMTNGTPATLDTAEFMTVKPLPKNSDGVQDLDLATKTGIYQVAGNGNAKPVNSPLAGISAYGILEVYQAGVYIMQRFVNVVDKNNAPTYQRIRTENGGFAPWVLISRGGVNTLHSTNYRPTERKGGQHERDNRPCDRANGHVSFRSVADWIEWLGRDEEDFGKESIFGDTGYRSFAKDSGRRCQRDFNSGDLRNQHRDSKCPECSRIAHMYQASSSCSADIHLNISGEYIDEVFRCRFGSLVRLGEGVIARKEAAV